MAAGPGGHALLHRPLSVFHANDFWPVQNTLAYSDSLLGYSPVGIVRNGFGRVFDAPTTAALVTYNLVFIAAYAMAFLGVPARGRALGFGVGPGLVAGSVFAYAPWRLVGVLAALGLARGRWKESRSAAWATPAAWPCSPRWRWRPRGGEDVPPRPTVVAYRPASAWVSSPNACSARTSAWESASSC